MAQADLVQAGLLRNPLFDGAVLLPIAGGQPEFDLGVALRFLDIFYLPLRKRVAAAQFDEAKLRVTGAVLDFAAAVRGAFYRTRLTSRCSTCCSDCPSAHHRVRGRAAPA